MIDAAIHGQPKLGLLLRIRGVATWNRLRGAVQEAPVRLAVTALLIALIWAGLYRLFQLVFLSLERSPLEATVAIPMIFNFFFIAMLALLAFSNAIIAYGFLFNRSESPFLLTLPLAPLDLVTLKYLESLVLSSWSVVLLGLPLMFAMAESADEPVSRVLFLAFFLAFVPIPGALGLLGAWAVAAFFPKKAARSLTILAGVLLVGLFLVGLRSIRIGEEAMEYWLRSFTTRMSFVQAAFLPNHWVSAGIDHAMHGQFSEAFSYLGVTLANAFFLSWLAVQVVSAGFIKAYDRVSAGRGGAGRAASPSSGGAAGALFFYLPLRLRLVAAKDLRTFLRDPAQWSQLTILFGLLVLYLTNMPTLRMQLSASGWLLIIPFLNLCAVSLILATFTCRFVFPLMSMEGQKLWLMGVLPMDRGALLVAKFAFAMTVTLAVAVTAMCIGAILLGLDWVWTGIHLIVTIGVCFGLCGFSVGIGSRLPMFNQANPARIANGLGGTTNLLASIALVGLTLSGVGMATWRSRYLPEGQLPDARSLLYCAASLALSVSGGLAAMVVGARHLRRVEV
jgi:ABC-2 type transport system permease protein